MRCSVEFWNRHRTGPQTPPVLLNVYWTRLLAVSFAAFLLSGALGPVIDGVLDPTMSALRAENAARVAAKPWYRSDATPASLADIVASTGLPFPRDSVVMRGRRTAQGHYRHVSAVVLADRYCVPALLASVPKPGYEHAVWTVRATGYPCWGLDGDFWDTPSRTAFRSYLYAECLQGVRSGSFYEHDSLTMFADLTHLQRAVIYVDWSGGERALKVPPTAIGG